MKTKSPVRWLSTNSANRKFCSMAARALRVKQNLGLVFVGCFSLVLSFAQAKETNKKNIYEIHTSKMIDLSEVQQGIYFLKVYLDNDSVKLLRVTILR